VAVPPIPVGRRRVYSATRFVSLGAAGAALACPPTRRGTGRPACRGRGAHWGATGAGARAGRPSATRRRRAAAGLAAAAAAAGGRPGAPPPPRRARPLRHVPADRAARAAGQRGGPPVCGAHARGRRCRRRPRRATPPAARDRGGKGAPTPLPNRKRGHRSVHGAGPVARARRPAAPVVGVSSLPTASLDAIRIK